MGKKGSCHMLKNGLVKAFILMKDLLCKILWAPVYLRFNFRGHRSAWRIPTHTTPFERLQLYRLGLQQQPGAIFLEVGSYLGASACFLAAAATEIGGGAKVYCVDSWQNNAMSEGMRDTWREFRENTLSYSPVVFPCQGMSVDIAKSFTGKINFLFLDGDHSYQGVRADVEAWLPLLAPGGVIALHDFGWAEGVKRIVTEFIQPRALVEHKLPNLYWAVLRQDV